MTLLETHRPLRDWGMQTESCSAGDWADFVPGAGWEQDQGDFHGHLLAVAAALTRVPDVAGTERMSARSWRITHPDANVIERNHYPWFFPSAVDALDPEWRAQTRAKMEEALSDPFVDDAAKVMLAMLDAIDALHNHPDQSHDISDWWTQVTLGKAVIAIGDGREVGLLPPRPTGNMVSLGSEPPPNATTVRAGPRAIELDADRLLDALRILAARLPLAEPEP